MLVVLAAVTLAGCEKEDASYTTSPSLKALIGTTTGNVAFRPPEAAPEPVEPPEDWQVEFSLARFTELENGSPAIEILMQVKARPGMGMELWLSAEDGTVARWSGGSTAVYVGTVCFQLELQREGEAEPPVGGGHTPPPALRAEGGGAGREGSAMAGTATESASAEAVGAAVARGGVTAALCAVGAGAGAVSGGAADVASAGAEAGEAGAAMARGGATPAVLGAAGAGAVAAAGGAADAASTGSGAAGMAADVASAASTGATSGCAAESLRAAGRGVLRRGRRGLRWPGGVGGVIILSPAVRDVRGYSPLQSGRGSRRQIVPPSPTTAAGTGRRAPESG